MSEDLMTQEHRQIVFGDLDAAAGAMVRRIPGIPPRELSTWMYQQAQAIVAPYVARGMNQNLLTFHLGMLVGQHLSAELVT